MRSLLRVITYLTNLGIHTPWNTVLLDRLTGHQLLKKFPPFYGTLPPHSQVSKTVPILSPIDPVHVPTSHYLKINVNIILTGYMGENGHKLIPADGEGKLYIIRGERLTSSTAYLYRSVSVISLFLERHVKVR